MRPLRAGFATILLLVAGFGAWATLAPIEGAIITMGQVEVAEGRQPIQHPEGGRVRAVHITEGGAVVAGQVLLELDDDGLRPEIALVEAQIAALTARAARLTAERDGADVVTFPPGGDAAEQAEQASLFTARREAEARTTARLIAHAASVTRQAEILRGEVASITRQQALVAAELSDQQGLFERGLAQSARVLGLEREAAALEGRQAELIAAIAAAEAQAADAILQQAERAATRQAEAGAALRELDLALSELRARHDLLTSREAALVLRAPLSGRVWGLQVTRAPAVLRPAEPALFLIPEDAPPVIAARIAPEDIDRITPDQRVRMRLTALDPHNTPEVTGRVTTVAPDVTSDPASGASFYRVEIIADAPLPAGITLLPGMQAEVFLLTGTTSPARYLLAPLLDHFRRALRDG